VRWLSTDGAVETKARRGGGSLPELDKKHWRRRDATGGASFYRHAHVGRTMGWLRRGVQCIEGSNGRSWRGSDAEGIFVRTPAARR
jgi:hypothetical protein